jgi:hypothetical protein
MLRRNFRRSSGVILDVCAEHGSWLDADELEQITGFILSGGQPSPLLVDPPPRTRAEQRAQAALAKAGIGSPWTHHGAQAPIGRGVLSLIKLLLD